MSKCKDCEQFYSEFNYLNYGTECYCTLYPTWKRIGSNHYCSFWKANEKLLKKNLNLGKSK